MKYLIFLFLIFTSCVTDSQIQNSNNDNTNISPTLQITEIKGAFDKHYTNGWRISDPLIDELLGSDFPGALLIYCKSEYGQWMSLEWKSMFIQNENMIFVEGCPNTFIADDNSCTDKQYKVVIIK